MVQEGEGHRQRQDRRDHRLDVASRRQGHRSRAFRGVPRDSARVVPIRRLRAPQHLLSLHAPHTLLGVHADRPPAPGDPRALRLRHRLAPDLRSAAGHLDPRHHPERLPPPPPRPLRALVRLRRRRHRVQALVHRRGPGCGLRPRLCRVCHPYYVHAAAHPALRALLGAAGRGREPRRVLVAGGVVPSRRLPACHLARCSA
mmetsp:Transcript_4927/g.14393  ORF Transcript_4927/g.14393 Transcript_4927/m.14393 type:complete len:201 (-) Transcript_4927:808-1410(-)